MGKNVSTKRRVAIRAIIGYVIAFGIVTFGTSFEQVEGTVNDISNDTLIVEATTGNEYAIKNDNVYTQSKKVGDSIDLKVKGGRAYDKVRGEGEELNEQGTRTIMGIGVGIMAIVTLLVIYGWPFGNEYTEVVYHVGEDDV